MPGAEIGYRSVLRLRCALSGTDNGYQTARESIGECERQQSIRYPTSRCTGRVISLLGLALTYCTRSMVLRYGTENGVWGYEVMGLAQLKAEGGLSALRGRYNRYQMRFQAEIKCVFSAFRYRNVVSSGVLKTERVRGAGG
eukprot:2356956-Rhodomonas_salina.3